MVRFYRLFYFIFIKAHSMDIPCILSQPIQSDQTHSHYLNIKHVNVLWSHLVRLFLVSILLFLLLLLVCLLIGHRQAIKWIRNDRWHRLTLGGLVAVGSSSVGISGIRIVRVTTVIVSLLSSVVPLVVVVVLVGASSARGGSGSGTVGIIGIIGIVGIVGVIAVVLGGRCRRVVVVAGIVVSFLAGMVTRHGHHRSRGRSSEKEDVEELHGCG
ncbi:hypothetical protein F4809DRAFT_620057 [Biscogniauxia mediterranea]|nr:hypothetical protein F4809DRAFT_620057 [Biscogniauxia mediterranea]